MNALEAEGQSLSIAAEVERLRALLQQGEHDEVRRITQSLLTELPENRDVLLVAAASFRMTEHIPEALATLERLENAHPRFSQTFQERGLCHVARKDAPGAIDALLRAVNINPALPMSWRMLEGVYRLTGDRRNAAVAAEHGAALKALPPAVVAATSLFADEELVQAEDMIRAYLLRHGDHPEAMRLLAKIGMARDVLDDAEILLEATLSLVPDHTAARYEYAQCLVRRHKYVQAREQIERLLALDPDRFDYRSLASTAAVGLGEHERAISLYEAMLAQAPGSPDVHLWLGHALKTIGDVPAAIASYQAAAAARADFGDAYWSLANLKTYRFTDGEIDRMRLEEAAPPPAPEDRYHLCFALGKALEDRGETAESWRYYERGNALKRAESRYRPAILETNTREQVRICTRTFFARRSGWGDPRPDPIFIVGLPRSGSTLIEQILASHSQVEGTQELPDIQRTVLDLQGREPDPDHPRYPALLTEMTDADFRTLGEIYLTNTNVYRTGRAYFIDKMPNNFRHIGLIHLMLPNARIIDARREPMSCCFSNLKQLFAHGQEFSYGFEDIARYYRTYVDLMEHWDEALPGRILRVHYEDVVADLEACVRRILDHCDLAFEPACIEFHRSKRSVRTPSSEQVRQPIFRDGLDSWKKYKRWLGPLETALGDVAARYDRHKHP